MDRQIYAWHFLHPDRMVWASPGAEVEPGITYSVRPLDALRGAPGWIVCRVRLDGESLAGTDQVIARSGTVLWTADARDTVLRWVCWCVERALRRQRERGREPAAASWQAIGAARQWLAGEIGVDELRSACRAAYAAYAASDADAAVAAYAASEAASYAAAAYAASDAAYAAAASYAAAAAAYAAYAAAVGDDARQTERDAQNAELERVLWLLAPEGARDVEESAVDAALKAQGY